MPPAIPLLFRGSTTPDTNTAACVSTLCNAARYAIWYAPACSKKFAIDISGHKTADVFLRYNITSTTDVLAAMRQIEVAAARALPPKEPMGRALKGKLSVQSGRKSLYVVEGA
jgi:hypothetical protein